MKLSDVIEWCKEDVARMREQRESLKSGGRLHSFVGGKQIDVTDEWIKLYDIRIAETEALIARQP